MTNPVRVFQMNKRSYGVWFCLVLWGLCPLLATAQITDPLHLESGLLTGMPGSDPAIQVYKGIPYAAPPVGALRWHAPQPSSPWEGVRKADTFAPGCIQQVAGSRPPWTEEFMHQGSVSEDCLYLNVWTAAEDAGERRPILVYIHGGGFNEGSGSVAVYDGEELAKKGLVVVTVNYRLGALGFLAHPGLTAESGDNASGNFGLLDQVAALQWAKQNIAAFGGDPNNVTIAGQSAGAIAVYLLTVAPPARSLFHRAIVQSGPGGLASFGLSSTRTLVRPLSEAEADGAEFAKAKGTSSLQELRAMSVDDLTAGPASGGGPLRFGPVIDGYLIPDNVPAIYATGTPHDVPMLTGFNADEPSAFPGYGKMTAEAFRETARDRYGASAETFLALYPAATDEQAGNAQKASQRDVAAVAVGRLAAERAHTTKTDLYLYYFERGIPWPERPEFDAFHTAEVPYFFNNLRMLDRPWEPLDRQLADTMSSYWANFAASGNPNGAGLPEWPAYDDQDVRFMRFGDPVEPGAVTNQSTRDFFEAYLAE